jgi:hypothetical protein
MTDIHWVPRQNKLEIPRGKDEVNKWEIHECDGWVHDPDTMVTPLTPKPIHNSEMTETYEYRCDERLKTKNEESTRLTDMLFIMNQ